MHQFALWYVSKKEERREKEDTFPSFPFPPFALSRNTTNARQIRTALESEGFGANLQHYNPVVDIPTKQKFSVDMEWRLRAQLVFGGVEGTWPEGKEKKPLSETVKWLGRE